MSDLISSLPTDRVYKLLRAQEWAALRQQGQTRGSADDERDGFVHLSSAEQVAGTLERYFADAAELYLLALDPLRLRGELRWEPSRGGCLFPHLYGLLRWADCTVVASHGPASGWSLAVSTPAADRVAGA